MKKKEGKREHILSNAITIFAKKGIRNTKMIDVANAANIGKGTLYEYFSSKENLIGNMFDYWIQQFRKKQTARIQRETEPVTKIKALIKNTFELYQKLKDFMEVLFDFWAEGVRYDDNVSSFLSLKNMYTEYRKRITLILRNGIKEGVFKNDIDVHLTASTMIALLDGMLLQYVFLDDSHSKPNGISEKISEMVLQGILTQS